MHGVVGIAEFFADPQHTLSESLVLSQGGVGDRLDDAREIPVPRSLGKCLSVVGVASVEFHEVAE